MSITCICNSEPTGGQKYVPKDTEDWDSYYSAYYGTQYTTGSDCTLPDGSQNVELRMWTGSNGGGFSGTPRNGEQLSRHCAARSARFQSRLSPQSTKVLGVWWRHPRRALLAWSGENASAN